MSNKRVRFRTPFALVTSLLFAAIAVLIDLPRAKIHSSEGKKLERFDPILNAEAAGLHYLLSPPNDVAA